MKKVHEMMRLRRTQNTAQTKQTKTSIEDSLKTVVNPDGSEATTKNNKEPFVTMKVEEVNELISMTETASKNTEKPVQEKGFVKKIFDKIKPKNDDLKGDGQEKHEIAKQLNEVYSVNIEKERRLVTYFMVFEMILLLGLWYVFKWEPMTATMFQTILIFAGMLVLKETGPDILRRLRLKFMRPYGYGIVRLVLPNTQETQYVTKYDRTIKIGKGDTGKTWNVRPEAITYDGNIPILTVNLLDTEPINLNQADSDKDDEYDPNLYTTMMETAKIMGALMQKKDEKKAEMLLWCVLGGLVVILLFLFQMSGGMAGLSKLAMVPPA